MKEVLMATGAVAAGCLIGFGSQTASASVASETELSFPELQERCEEILAQGDEAPQMFISCYEERYTWLPGEGMSVKPVLLPTNRMVGGAVVSTRFTVSFQNRTVPSDDQEASCYLEKWRLIVPDLEVETNCRDIVKHADITSLCTPLVAAKISEDPSYVVYEKTDEAVSLCDLERGGSAG